MAASAQAETPVPDDQPALSKPILALFCGVKFLVHALLLNRYGYFRDELYFLDCGRHLDWGYVDHAPMIGWMARAALMLGGSLPVLRLFPAVAGTALVGLSILIAWRLGGGKYAQALTGLSVLIVPIYLAIDSLFTMNCLEPLFWMGCAYIMIRIIQTGNSHLWIWFGVLAGLGVMNKHSTLFFGLAVFVALWLSPQRKEFLKPWVWIGGAIAIAIFTPNLIWQVHHHFPTLEDLHNVQNSGKNVVLGPLAFTLEQIKVMHPVLFPVWAAGLFLMLGRGARYRLLGWTFLIVYFEFLIMHGKNYYVVPIYPMMLAAGAVAIESWLQLVNASQRRLAQAVVLAIIALQGAATAPLMLPMLSPQSYLAYAAKLHIAPSQTEVHHSGPLPQMFGDQFGWPELVGQIASVYDSLPPEERARTGILTGNYGEAGAVNLFGKKYGLPTAMSGHQTYYFWGTHGFQGDQIITIQYGPHYLSQICDNYHEVADHFSQWGMAEENQPIYLCHLKQPLDTIWEDQKHWD